MRNFYEPIKNLIRKKGEISEDLVIEVLGGLVDLDYKKNIRDLEESKLNGVTEMVYDEIVKSKNLDKDISTSETEITQQKETREAVLER